LPIDDEEPPPTDDEEQLASDEEDQLATDEEDQLATDEEADADLVEQHNKRFLQAVSYFIEWAKHIITIGSALMLLSVALLKDIVRDAHAPVSYAIAGLLVLSYLSMLGTIWLALRFVRFAASCVLTTASQIVTTKKLNELRTSLDRVQTLFLVSLAFFAALALCALLAWAFGLASSASIGR
jgi:hypothetical protein